MKPIGNIFGFDCAICEHNRHCYGGNMGNQFRYCQKSAEKIQNLDNLEKQNKQLKSQWCKLKEYLHNVDVVVDYSENYDGHFINYDELVNKMQEIEQGSDSNE